MTIELVSGGIEPNEDPLVCAKRELQEEIGVEAADWTDLGSTDPFTANVVSPTKMYLARDLKFVETAPEGTEQIERVKFAFADVIEMVMSGEITHSPSCVTILKAARILEL